MLDRRRGALHEMVREVHEDLARARVAGTAGLVHAVVDVDPAHVVRVLADAVQLLQGDRPERRVDLYVLAENDDVHVLPIELFPIEEGGPQAGRVAGVYAAPLATAPGRGVRAIVAATTDCGIRGPCSARAAAANVPPVVATSSTTRIVAPRRSRRAPRSFGPSRRARASRPVCGGTGLAAQARRRRRPQRLRATARARSSPWSTPCARMRCALAGAHVTRSNGSGADCTATARTRPRRGTRKRRSFRYLARATSSRATPSYA